MTKPLYFESTDGERLRLIAAYLKASTTDNNYEIEHDMERIAKKLELLEYTVAIYREQIQREAQITICQRIADLLREKLKWKRVL